MLIDDGYTLRATVAGMVFAFRPMLRRERVWLLEEMNARKLWDAEVVWAFADLNLVEHVDLPLRKDFSDNLASLRGSDFPAWQTVFELIVGIGKDSDEAADRKNLETGIPLLRKFGHLEGGDTCSLCQRFLFDPERGEFEIDDETGERIPRFDEAILACQTHEGCPNGTPDKPLSLSRKNRQAFKHYQECVAVSHFPDDPIVRQNAAIIRSALLRCQRPVNHAPARAVELLVPVYEPPRGSGAGRQRTVPDGSGAGGLDR